MKNCQIEMNEKEYIESIPMWAENKNSLNDVKKNLELFNIKIPEIVHVAGTNGKGSVCAYLSNILMAEGKRVGTFISPHLQEVNERILLNMTPISDNELEGISKKVREVLKSEGAGDAPTYFEYLFYIAMVYFSKEKPDYIILETGMGGRLDVTNVFEHTDISIITSIGMDHMQYLGDSLELIAKEKAGIIKPGSTVIYDNSNAAVNTLICEKAAEQNAEVISLSEFDYEKLDFLNADYKKKAAGLAVLAAVRLLGRINEESAPLKKTVWHGRMEELREDVILDGAHNEPAAREFAKNAERIAAGRSKGIKILISVVKDKELESIFDIITSIPGVRKYYLTGLHSYRTNNISDLKKSLIKSLDKNGKIADIDCFDNSGDAFRKACAEKKADEILFCVGSLYLMGEILEGNI